MPEILTQSRLDFLGNRFIRHKIRSRLKITFEAYIEGYERYDRILAFMNKNARNRRRVARAAA